MTARKSPPPVDAPDPARAERRLTSVSRPKQARSEQTLRRLLDAAEALIEEKGLPDVSIPEIVRHAGSSVGGFYARFQDKNGLLRALEERFFNRMLDRVDELIAPGAWGGAPVPAIVDACMAELVERTRRHHNLIAAFLTRAAQDPEFREDGLRFRRQVSARIGELLLRHRDALHHPEPGLAIDLGVQMAFGLMLQHVAFGGLAAGGRGLSEADIRRELSRSFLAYLGVRA